MQALAELPEHDQQMRGCVLPLLVELTAPARPRCAASCSARPRPRSTWVSFPACAGPSPGSSQMAGGSIRAGTPQFAHGQRMTSWRPIASSPCWSASSAWTVSTPQWRPRRRSCRPFRRDRRLPGDLRPPVHAELFCGHHRAPYPGRIRAQHPGRGRPAMAAGHALGRWRLGDPHPDARAVVERHAHRPPDRRTRPQLRGRRTRAWGRAGTCARRCRALSSGYFSLWQRQPEARASGGQRAVMADGAGNPVAGLSASTQASRPGESPIRAGSASCTRLTCASMRSGAG
jgi:hypothetical protein